MVLDDKAVEKLDQKSIDKVMDPKIIGTKNLFQKYPQVRKFYFPQSHLLLVLKDKLVMLVVIPLWINMARPMVPTFLI